MDHPRDYKLLLVMVGIAIVVALALGVIYNHKHEGITLDDMLLSGDEILAISRSNRQGRSTRQPTARPMQEEIRQIPNDLSPVVDILHEENCLQSHHLTELDDLSVTCELTSDDPFSCIIVSFGNTIVNPQAIYARSRNFGVYFRLYVAESEFPLACVDGETGMDEAWVAIISPTLGIHYSDNYHNMRYSLVDRVNQVNAVLIQSLYPDQLEYSLDYYKTDIDYVAIEP